MSYCSVEDMRRLLPEKVLIGDSNIGTPVPGRPGNQGSQRSNITPQEAEKYIEYAQQYIDGRLRPYYLCPLRRIKTYETPVLNNLTAGTDIIALVEDSGYYSRGDLIRIQSKNTMETSYIKEIRNLTTFVITRLENSYSTFDELKVSMLKYPDPIPLITTRFAVSFLLDRLFVAEQSPDVSQYGKNQRNNARDDIENILTGEVFLVGQELTGRRFVRGQLFDAYRSPAELQTGQDKE